MAKVKITGHASGTGVFTITAPNSNTDRTITLPDASVTLGTDATKLPLAGGTLTGNVVIGAIADAAERSLTINSSTDSLLKLKTQNDDEVGAVYFGNSTAAVDGRIQYDARRMRLWTAGSSRLELTADGRGLSQFTAKAWVNFNGSGTPSIRSSHNCSSITDVGTGDYKINFTTAMANVNYAGAGLASDDGNTVAFRNNTAALTVNDARVSHKNASNSYVDGAVITFIFFGD